MTTNLTIGGPSAHQTGVLWRLVRASMTIVGLIPPLVEDGELLARLLFAMMSESETCKIAGCHCAQFCDMVKGPCGMVSL